MIAVSKPTWIIGHSVDFFDIESFCVVNKFVVALVSPAACVANTGQGSSDLHLCSVKKFISITDSITRESAMYGIKVFIIAL